MPKYATKNPPSASIPSNQPSCTKPCSLKQSCLEGNGEGGNGLDCTHSIEINTDNGNPPTSTFTLRLAKINLGHLDKSTDVPKSEGRSNGGCKKEFAAAETVD